MVAATESNRRGWNHNRNRLQVPLWLVCHIWQCTLTPWAVLGTHAYSYSYCYRLPDMARGSQGEAVLHKFVDLLLEGDQHLQLPLQLALYGRGSQGEAVIHKCVDLLLEGGVVHQPLDPFLVHVLYPHLCPLHSAQASATGDVLTPGIGAGQ